LHRVGPNRGPSTQVKKPGPFVAQFGPALRNSRAGKEVGLGADGRRGVQPAVRQEIDPANRDRGEVLDVLKDLEPRAVKSSTHALYISFVIFVVSKIYRGA
jgi:hypothetical protein